MEIHVTYLGPGSWQLSNTPDGRLELDSRDHALSVADCCLRYAPDASISIAGPDRTTVITGEEDEPSRLVLPSDG